VAQLEIKRGEATTVLPILGDRVTIGRSEASSIRLAGDPSVSRDHALLELGDGWTIHDLHSRNGTFVNGERVAATARLHFGDKIQVGKFTLSLLGSPTDTESTVHEAASSAPPNVGRLTAREREILSLVALGATDQAIAHKLGIKVKTVHSHLERVHEKTGRRRRPDLTRLAIETGIIAANDAS